jgi:hypothetical protein
MRLSTNLALNTQAVQCLLILSAYGGVDVAARCWESLPTVRAVMEMCITRTYAFPALPGDQVCCAALG